MNNKAVATGRAKCRCCSKKIVKDEVCVYASSYQGTGYCHFICDPVEKFLEEQGGK